MRIRFWGTRGSLPVSLRADAVRDKLRDALRRADGRRFEDDAALERFLDDELGFPAAGAYGGSSACVEVETGGDDYLLLDAGTGLREFGSRLPEPASTGGRRFHILLSHVHWDHILGFPFFLPAYTDGDVIRLIGCHPEEVLREAFQRQLSEPCFPVDLERLAAAVEFVVLEPGEPHEIAGFTVRAHLQRHPFDSYGYRLERDGKAMVYSTDSEHKESGVDADNTHVEFFRDADVVIFDAQYSLAEATTTKEDWGHSSNIVGVELCRLAGVRHLVLFHHDPGLDDAGVDRMLREAVRYEELSRSGAVPLRISAAYDGMELEL